MAAPHARTGINTPLLNRYSNDEDPIETRLPSGKCNFTNLSVGGNAPICGCRRFWDKALATPRTPFGDTIRSQARSGFCMCEHHACYHDDAPEGQLGRVSVDVNMAEATLTTIQNTPHRQAVTGQGQTTAAGQNVGRPHQSVPDTFQWSRYIHSGSMPSLPAIPSQCLLPSDNGSMTSGSQGASIRPSAGLGLRTVNHLPTINSGIAMDHGPIDSRRMQTYQDANGNGFLQSLTEIATPSVRASQDPTSDADIGKNISSVQDALENFAKDKARAQSAALKPAKHDSISQVPIKQSGSDPGPGALTLSEGANEGSLIPRLRHLVNDLAEYPTKIQNHEHRLDLLENASFSNAAIEDLQDTDDRMDTRVCDLEERIVELEKAHAALNDASSVGSRQLGNTSFDSRASVTSSAMIASAMDRLDASRVEALEAQVAELQASAPPSHSHPWEVEVVFLPFGSRLMGIWSSQRGMSQRSRLNSTATDDWTQTQHNSMAAAQAYLTTHDQASAWERSVTDLADPNDSWLMAKACGLRSRVDERLRSRGLVKLVRILGPDARDVQAAMMTAFGDLPDVLTEDPYTPRDDENSGVVPPSLKNYIGLSASWIPLRKLHKDSCLRFLNPSEMVTPALWTVPFLSASVAMRHPGVRRLYVTQRDSYVQHLGSHNADWTWQKLRQLPRVYPDQPSFSHTPEADAHEPCWEFDERLDPPHESIHSSFASNISSLSIRDLPHEEHLEPASPSDHFSSAAVSPNASTTPTSVAPPQGPPLSPLKERNPFRPIHTRTASMPILIPTKTSQTSKRRIASFEHESQSSPTRAPSTSAQNLIIKRRRISRSPSRPRDTPRYSVGPPSPYTFIEELAQRDGKKERGMTPFAYATPHSNAPYIERPRSSIGIYEDEDDAADDHGSTTDDLYAEEEQGYEANALSDFDSDAGSEELGHARQIDEEWEGVQDGMHGDDNDGVTNYESRTIGTVVPSGLRREVDDDQGSEGSSVPSEYPSTQQQLFSASTKAGFRIHVDEEVEDRV